MRRPIKNFGYNYNMCEKIEKTKKKDNDSCDNGGIETNDNHIYFYDEINPFTILSLRKEIYNVSNDQKKLKVTFSNLDLNIFLHINSGGGFVTDGLNAMDIIMNNSVPITTIIEGISASSATLLSMAGYHRQMQKNSIMLIHQIRSFMWGTQAELEDEIQNIKLLETKILDFYEKRSKLSRKELKEMMKTEKTFDSKDALKYGFIDEII